jgi:hypothetical protein
VHKTKSKSTTTVLEEANQDSQGQGQPADRPSTQKKVLYIKMLKVLQWTRIHTKTKRILQLFKPLALAPSY